MDVFILIARCQQPVASPLENHWVLVLQTVSRRHFFQFSPRSTASLLMRTCATNLRHSLTTVLHHWHYASWITGSDRGQKGYVKLVLKGPLSKSLLWKKYSTVGGIYFYSTTVCRSVCCMVIFHVRMSVIFVFVVDIVLWWPFTRCFSYPVCPRGGRIDLF